MLHYDWDQSLGFWLCAATQSIRRALNTELARENITMRQWEVLACLAFSQDSESGLSQTELADRLGIEAPTVVGILDRMERDGWLDRRSCNADRRKKRIFPTKKAEKVWQQMVACAHRVRARATEGISERDLQQLRVVCEQIRQNLDVVPPAEEPLPADESLNDTTEMFTYSLMNVTPPSSPVGDRKRRS